MARILVVDDDLLDLPPDTEILTTLPAAARWARLVVAAARCAEDPRTLKEWSRAVHMARATLENRCRAVKLSPKASLDCARMLRCVMQGCRWGCQPDVMLDCDPRTMERLRRKAGLGKHAIPPCGEWPAIDRFLSSQSFVSDPFALRALRAELRTIVPAVAARSSMARRTRNPIACDALNGAPASANYRSS